MQNRHDRTTGNNTQRAVIVVGAGRSGTSSITRGLQALGVALGEHLRAGNGKNPTGFFEDKSLLRLNKRLRRRLGVRADSVSLIEPGAWDQPNIRRLEGQAIRIIRGHFRDYPLWGYKYGRTLRLLPFWERVFDKLDLDVSYVVAVRNPLSVARSRAKLDKRRGRQEHSDLEWLVSVVPYFNRLRDRSFVVVDYDNLMADPVSQLTRIADTLHLPRDADTHSRVTEFTNAFLQPGMRHSRYTNEDLCTDVRINPVTRDAYLLLHRLANDEWQPGSDEFWDHWREIEQWLELYAPLLKTIDLIESERRIASIHPAGPLQVLPWLIRKQRA